MQKMSCPECSWNSLCCYRVLHNLICHDDTAERENTTTTRSFGSPGTKFVPVAYMRTVYVHYRSAAAANVTFQHCVLKRF